MKQKWVDAFMDTAERFAQLSSAKRLKVGAVVVKDNRIISIGYNGMPSGWDNDCERKEYVYGPVPMDPWLFKEEDSDQFYMMKTRPEVIHAEANAISKLAKSGDSGDGADLFCTHAPCIECAKIIYGAGVKRVFFKHAYRDEIGLDFLDECRIVIEKVDQVD